MHKATAEDIASLKAYLATSIAIGDAGIDRIQPRADVTVVMYFFWGENDAPDRWPDFAGALLATWRNCGFLHTVVVTNAKHACVVDFAAHHSNVEIQVEETLLPGNINSMSVDCNSRLHTRFGTKYVLIVQDDGFPLRPGLDEFVDLGYDFIGSPYCRAKPLPNFLTAILNYCPSNGGFSLRTKKICKMAACYWEKFFSSREFVVDEMSEDLFYTKTLPTKKPLYWFGRRQAPSIIAEKFSYEGVFPCYAKSMPFGFHTATAFGAIERQFGSTL